MKATDKDLFLDGIYAFSIADIEDFVSRQSRCFKYDVTIKENGIFHYTVDTIDKDTDYIIAKRAFEDRETVILYLMRELLDNNI